MPGTYIMSIINLALVIGLCFLLYLVVRAILRYNKSKEIRKEKSATQKSLGEVLKGHRTQCKMTQEFVAEAIGVSRQAVSKWENGASDPTMSNLIALSKLFNIPAEVMLSEIKAVAKMRIESVDEQYKL